MRTAICAVVTRGGSILLVKKNHTWILPGGKPENQESHVQTLIREFAEELPGVRIKEVTDYWGKFLGITPNTGDEIETHVYRLKVEGSIDSSAEISESRWVPLALLRTYQLSDITRKIVDGMYQTGVSPR